MFVIYFIIPVSGPVTDLQTNSPDNSTLVISWRPPTTPNGNIISYTVRIDNIRSGTTLRDIKNHSAAITSLTENDLGTILFYKYNKFNLTVYSCWSSISCECVSSESSRSRKHHYTH